MAITNQLNGRFGLLLWGAGFCASIQLAQVCYASQQATSNEMHVHPRLGRTTWFFPANQVASPASQSEAPPFPDAAAQAFAVTSPADELVLQSSGADAIGWHHHRFQQLHDGVPVFSGQLLVHYDQENVLKSVNGRFYQIPDDLDIQASIPINIAEQAARQLLQATRATVVSCELTIVDPGWYGDPSIGPRLAYHVIVADRPSLRELGVFVDAQTGNVLDAWDMFCTAKNRQVYTGVGQSEFPGAAARFEGDPATGNADVDAVYDFAGDTYDYFLFGFDRNGPDDAGGPVSGTADVNDIGAIGCPNAGWNFNLEFMAFCTGTASDDIVAHEWVHAVTQNTANLIYQNQSGQLNESFSDVFGELVDLFNGGAAFVESNGVTPWESHPSGSGTDSGNGLRSSSACTSVSTNVRWLIGEDATAFVDPLRDMWQPNCYLDPASATDDLQICSLADNGGVHSGSGVVNHAFAMLCDGKSFNGQTVNGIGPIKAGAIWYRTLTVYLTVGSDFDDAAIAFVQSANDLVGVFPQDPRTGLPSDEPVTAFDVQQVVNAMAAVELSSAESCGATRPMLTSAVATNCSNPQIVLADDFESGVNGWSVANSAPPTPYDWEQVTDLPFGRPGTAWFILNTNIGDCITVSEAGTHDLVSPAFIFPADADTLTLEFSHFAEVEPRFDGGVIEISVNGGAWQLVPSAAFRNNSYNTSFFTAAEQGNTSPLAGEVAFSGVGGNWGETTAELAGLAAPGDSLRLRFRFSKDQCAGLNGWWIDDVRVFACDGIDCNNNGVDDEIDRLDGPADRLLMAHELNRLASANFSDNDPHPAFGTFDIAEDFQLLFPAEIHRLRFWGGYDDDAPVATDEFTIRIYENDGGIPGAVLYEEVGAATLRTATGAMFFRNDEYQYDVTLSSPLSLPAGTYMLSIANNTVGSAGTWLWARAWAGDIPGASFLASTCPDWCRINPFNMALEIYGERIGFPLGDVNRDEAVDLLDVPVFVEQLVNGGSVVGTCSADVNQDKLLNAIDIAAFVDCLTVGCGP